MKESMHFYLPSKRKNRFYSSILQEMLMRSLLTNEGITNTKPRLWEGNPACFIKQKHNSHEHFRIRSMIQQMQNVTLQEVMQTQSLQKD